MFLGRLRGKAPQQADAEFLRDITALRNSSTIDPNTIGALGLYLFTAPTLIAAHVEGIEVHLVGDIAGST